MNIMEYNDNTILTHGKYKFTSLSRVPADYLLKFINDKKAPLHDYVVENIEKILMRKDKDIPAIELPCDKYPYASKSIAKAVLNKISKQEQEHKKPIRAYECEICNAWHLTSKTSE